MAKRGETSVAGAERVRIAARATRAVSKLKALGIEVVEDPERQKLADAGWTKSEIENEIERGRYDEEVKRPVGRPRTAAPLLPIYDSAAQCAAATGIPETVLKKAKRAGCDAFRSNRVDLGRLLPFLFATEDGENWGAERQKYQALNEKRRFEESQKILVAKAPVEKGIHAAEEFIFAELARKFLSELPPKLVNLDAPAIRAKSDVAIEELKAKFREQLRSAIAGTA